MMSSGGAVETQRYYYQPNVKQNNTIFQFAIWDGSSGAQRNRIVGFAVTEESARGIVHQLNTFGYVED